MLFPPMPPWVRVNQRVILVSSSSLFLHAIMTSGFDEFIDDDNVLQCSGVQCSHRVPLV